MWQNYTIPDGSIFQINQEQNIINQNNNILQANELGQNINNNILIPSQNKIILNDDNMNKDKGELNKTAIKIIPISNKKSEKYR